MSLLKEAIDEMDCPMSNDEEPGRLVDFHRLRNQQEEEEMEGGKDVVSMDVPFMIRILELVRENVKSDEDLHHVADKLIDLSRDGQPITMDHYDEFREFEGGGEGDYEEQGPEEEMRDEEDCEITSAGPISIEKLLAYAQKRKEGEQGGEEPTEPYIAPRARIE